MRKKLIETLTKYATKVEEAQTTNSVYFTMLNGIKVRVSDHHSTHPDCDLAIDVPENAIAYTIFQSKHLQNSHTKLSKSNLFIVTFPTSQ